MIALLLPVVLSACSPTPVAVPVSPPEASTAPVPAAAGADPRDEAEQMDTRTPVVLTPRMATHQKEQMRDHLVAVNQIVTALVSDDWLAMEAAAARLGSSPDTSMMCQHMGAATPGFTARGMEFHSIADGIGVAARAKDHAGVVKALGQSLAACTSCHADYRQEVVSGPAYALATGTPPPTHSEGAAAP